MPASPNADTHMLYGLADWVANMDDDSIPENIRHQARLSLIDTIGCQIAGASHPDSQRILSAEKTISLSDHRSASVGVNGDRLSIPAAAKVNSCMASILELDDNTAGHGSLVAVPVGLALGEALELSGKALITSMACTYEVIGRMLDSVFNTLKPYSECGIVPIVAPNTAGAAAQAAKLLGFDAASTFDAMNVGLTFLPFSPMVNAKVGSRVKPLVFSGWHVYSGCVGALYAEAGLTAADSTYESEYGGYLRSVARSWDADILNEGLGSTWYLESPNRKRHACCGYAHSSIDGIWDVLREHDLSADDIASIHVELPKDAFNLVGSPLLEELTANGAKFYLPYLLAVALLEGRPILPADTEVAALNRYTDDPFVARLIRDTHVTVDPEIPGRFSARLHVKTTDGRSYDQFADDAVGRGKQQFTDQEVEAKFRALVADELEESAADRILSTVHNIDQLDNVAELVALLRVSR